MRLFCVRFPREMGEVENRRWEANISVLGYTSASPIFKAVASIGVSWYTNTSLLYLPHHQPFLSFILFLTRSSCGSYKEFLSSGCLVFNGPGLIWFEATVVEILRSERRWRKVEKFWTSFLEKFISSNPKQISLRNFGEY